MAKHAHGRPGSVYQRFGPRLNLTNSLSYIAHPSPEFLGGQKCEIVARFSTTVTFDTLWIQNEGTCLKLILPPSATMTEIHCASHISPTYARIFTGGVKNFEIWHNLAFEAE